PGASGAGLDPLDQRYSYLRHEATLDAHHPELVSPVEERARLALAFVELVRRDRGGTQLARDRTHAVQARTRGEVQQLALVARRDGLGAGDLSCLRHRHPTGEECVAGLGTMF